MKKKKENNLSLVPAIYSGIIHLWRREDGFVWEEDPQIWASCLLLL